MTYEQFLQMQTNAGLSYTDTVLNRILYAQAYHESGNFTSNIFQQANNLYGMRPAVVRKKFYTDILKTASGDYAIYANYMQSYFDRVDLDLYNGLGDWYTHAFKSENEVKEYMKAVYNKGYATDPDYVSKWFNVFKMLFPNLQYSQTNQPGMNDSNNTSNTPNEGQGEDSLQQDPNSLKSSNFLTRLSFKTKFFLLLLFSLLAYFGYKRFRK